MYVYESHLGGIYTSEFLYEDDDLYCDQCGDWDWYVGEANSREEFIELFAPFDEDGYGEGMFQHEKESLLEQAEELFKEE